MQHQMLMYEKFNSLEMSATDIAKAVQSYLNNRRKEIPRCFFLSDKDLLNIIYHKDNFRVS